MKKLYTEVTNVKQIRPFSDERQELYCTYCGQPPDSRDHVPSKILLEDPFPKNLPVVPSCKNCNEGFSMDEAYFACLIECVKCGTTNMQDLKRAKIKSYLSRNAKLHKKLSEAKVVSNGAVLFNIDHERAFKVLLKFSKGHLKFENSEPVLNPPDKFWFEPIALLDPEVLDEFLADRSQSVLPEVGSRGMQYVLLNQEHSTSSWNVVQPGVYRYSVSLDAGTASVRIIIWEYLAAEFIWH